MDLAQYGHGSRIRHGGRGDSPRDSDPADDFTREQVRNCILNGAVLCPTCSPHRSNVESPVGGQGDIEEDLDSDLVAGGGGSGSSSGGGGGLCGAGLFSLSSPSVISRDINTPVCVPNMTSFVGMAVDQVKVLAGAKHHFDLVKFAVCHSSRSYAVEATRILTLGSASSTGAISATEVIMLVGIPMIVIKTGFIPDILRPRIRGAAQPQ